MKIALVILHANAARGGAERYTLDLAGALSARGHAVSLLSSSFGSVPENVGKVAIQAKGLTRLGRYESFLDSLDAHLARCSYDIVHAMLPVRRCDFYHPHAGIAAQVLTSRRWSDWLSIKRRRFAEVEREMLLRKGGPVVLCLSSYVKDALLRHYALPAEKSELLFNGVDLDRFTPANRSGAGQSIKALIIAQDFERKGLRQAIEALAQVRDRRLELVVIGRPSPAGYRRLARSLGVADRVIFAGPTSSPRDAYAAADFFVLPTRHDPCSLVVLEALAMGLPVITTRQNGASEVMIHGEHGFVLESQDDVQGLAQGYRLLLDAATRSRMRSAILALRPRLSQQEHVERLLWLYTSAGSSRGASR